MASQESTQSPIDLARSVLRSSWNTVLTVYYANSVSWRVLKAGALVFLGFFLWSAGNLLLSYQRGWTLLSYVSAYGLVLILYGPFHHLVVIPVALRWRRGRSDRRREVGKRLPNASLVVFLVIVAVLGTFPVYPVQIDFNSEFGDAAPDINPDLTCVKATDQAGKATVHCHLTRTEGIAAIRVESGGETVLVDDDPPYDFTITEDQIREVVGEKQFQVVLLDEDGDPLRRVTRSLEMIPER